MPISITKRSCLDSSSKKEGGQLFHKHTHTTHKLNTLNATTGLPHARNLLRLLVGSYSAVPGLLHRSSHDSSACRRPLNPAFQALQWRRRSKRSKMPSSPSTGPMIRSCVSRRTAPSWLSKKRLPRPPSLSTQKIELRSHVAKRHVRLTLRVVVMHVTYAQLCFWIEAWDGSGITYNAAGSFEQHPRLHDCTAARAHAPWMGGGGETSTLSQEPVPWSRSEAGGLRLHHRACVLGQPLPPVFAYCSNERANSHYQYIKTRHRAVWEGHGIASLWFDLALGTPGPLHALAEGQATSAAQAVVSFPAWQNPCPDRQSRPHQHVALCLLCWCRWVGQTGAG